MPAAQKMFSHFRERTDQAGMSDLAMYAHKIALAPEYELDFDDAIRISDMLVAVGRHSEATELLSIAANMNPHDYGLRIRLARQQIELGQFPKAEENLRWCQRRKSDDARVTSMLQIALRESSRMR
jgi:Flp pilus assembly protein TadD